ncbi:hypothetical protein CFC21_030233 [Triticum aestivum]|uniref:F-box protein At3g26010-like beta-propeller domain-containing protein n=2 Tax=Triticum aestivum TaxID=4565 RepID=A0A3B6DFF4_WHEAT|nr:uncharacterized protein LOC123049434 [Triticum aestivum]KAF7016691.1 hypothetical protein CFC21_030233 [Triticum aestivum]
MLLPLRRLSGHLSRAVALSASADVLLPLRRLPGHLRRSLSTAASNPPWAMIYRLSETPNYTRGASFSLAPPPSATLFSIPERAYDLEERKRNPDRRYVNVHASVVFAASQDGLLLLKTTRIRLSAHTAAGLNLARPTEQEAKVVMEEAVEQEYVRYVCNPITGQLVRLPDYLGMKEILQTATGLLTQADGGHGPPKRYAVVELLELNDEGRFVVFCFSSDTGKWDATVRPSPLQPGRVMRLLNHEVLAFGGRLWWVDVSLGVLSMDPFSDKCELRHIKLPPGSVLPRQSHAEICDLIKYRRMGVSDGRLLYVEVSMEAPYQIRSFVLDEESGRWTLEHQVSLDAKERPLVGPIDPLNADLLYLNLGAEVIVSVDMRRNRIIAQSSVLASGIQPCYCGSNVFLPCVLPSFLGSSQIPGKKGAPKQQTLADALVRSDKC